MANFAAQPRPIVALPLALPLALLLALSVAACAAGPSAEHDALPSATPGARGKTVDARTATRDAGQDAGADVKVDGRRDTADTALLRGACGSQECASPVPVCEASSHKCVQCVADDDCPFRHACAAYHCLAKCRNDTDCARDASTRCDTSLSLCFPCVTDAHCSGGTPYCANHACVQCKADYDCPAPQACRAGNCGPPRADAGSTRVDASTSSPLSPR